ncbi:MAG TPA: glycosyltransferase family 4 protein [Planctomycetota bacterium]|nr:glycosyltransferase family 4 protein [Planctomycetota bacterium]
MNAAPRVLLLAEAANPEWASVPLEGWSHARALAGIVEAHTVTHARNRAAFLRAGLVEGRDFTSVDSDAVAGPVYRLAELLRGGPGRGWTTLSAFSSLSYYYFEHLVWLRFRERLRAGQFDLVHRLTPLNPVTPSLMATRCRRIGVPFVLGPLNGGVPWPRGFDAARRREREWLSYVRDAYRLMPGYRSTLRDAAALIIGSRDTWDQVPPSSRARCVYIPENAVDPLRFPEDPPRPASARLRVVFLGRLVPYKGPDLLIEAAAPLIRDGRLELTFVGDGPERGNLEQQIRSCGVGAGVRLLGWVNQSEVHRHLAEADVMAFPSIREFGGAVALEAMISGAVPIVMNYGGPGELVTASTGYLLEMGSRPAIVEQLRGVLGKVAADPDQLVPRRRAGVRRVRTRFTWLAKAAQVREVYRWVLGRRQDKPDFGMPLSDTDPEGHAERPVKN